MKENVKCENCKAVFTYFDGIETVYSCKCGISEDEAYSSSKDIWGCKLSDKTINERIHKYDNR